MIIKEYIKNNSFDPLFINGDSLTILKEINDDSIDCIITSPPYYMKREYLKDGIGLEKTYNEYIDNLLLIIKEIKRILKPTGSFWFNIGDSYKDKQLLNIPHRISIRMQDEQNWILRNTIIWDKVKGTMTSSKDNLGNQYEFIFHFVKDKTNYFYDSNQVRNTPRKVKIENGAVVSATGVTGIKYKRKIELSTELSEFEKQEAQKALKNVLSRMENGEISDFRMVIRGSSQRITNGDSIKLSGRAKELRDKGYYFLFYNSKGSMISDLWQIIPEDSRGRKLHYAPFPIDLVKNPILLTCPEKGIVLDPFSGTGTTSYVAKSLKRKSVGIDIKKEYIDYSTQRCK